jgi:hypothetical protein
MLTSSRSGYRSSFRLCLVHLAVIINVCTKEARKLDENADGQVPAHEARNRMPLPYYTIISAIVLFTLSVGFETYENMEVNKPPEKASSRNSMPKHIT